MVSSSSSPRERLAQMMLGHCIEQAIGVAVALGIPELLHSQPRTIDDLASQVGADVAALRHLMKALAAIGVWSQSASDQYQLTPASVLLQQTTGSSAAFRAIFYTMPQMWQAWGHLSESIATGSSAFQHVHGMSFYQYLRGDEQLRSVFCQYMSAVAKEQSPMLIDAIDLSWAQTVIDVAAGHGSLLTAVLRANPQLHGTLFDLPELAEEASRLVDADVAHRISAEGGDMFESIPFGADAYILKSVLCDWDDVEAQRILTACRMAMRPQSRLFVIEALDRPGEKPGYESLMDLHVLVLFGGGGLRPIEKLESMLESADLRLLKITHTQGPAILRARSRG